MRLAAVDERGVGAEGNIVQKQPLACPPDVDSPFLAVEGLECPERVAAVEAEVACEVVARTERDTDERKVTVDCDLGDRRERTVAAGHADRLGFGIARKRGGVLTLA